MVTKVFAVYDKKAEAFMAPFVYPAVGQALRAFSDTCNNPESVFFRHPADFDLYELGVFDDACGEFTCEKHFLIAGVSVKTFIGDTSATVPRFNGNEESKDA